MWRKTYTLFDIRPGLV